MRPTLTTFQRGVKLERIVHTCPTPYRRVDHALGDVCHGKTTCDVHYAATLTDNEDDPTRWLGYIETTVVTCVACLGTRKS